MALPTALPQYTRSLPPGRSPSAPLTRSNRPDRIRNYAELNKGYVARGRIDTWVDVRIFDRPRATGQMGRPLEYSEGLIEMLLLLKIKFNLPYRDLEGFASSLFELFNRGSRKAVPSFGTIATRVRALGRDRSVLQATLRSLAQSSSTGTKCLLIDSTGVSIQGWARGGRPGPGLRARSGNAANLLNCILPLIQRPA